MRRPAVNRTLRDRRGIAAVELALLAPMLFLFLLTFLDGVYLGRGHLRAHSTAVQIGQIVSQCRSVAASDQAQIFDLAQRTLRPFSDSGKRWAVKVTAIRTNAQGQAAQKWTMDNRNSSGAGAAFVSNGTAMPTGYTLRNDQIIFRTEVFVEVDAALLSKANSLLASALGSWPRFDIAASSVLHMSRSPDADKLNTNTSPEACFS